MADPLRTFVSLPISSGLIQSSRGQRAPLQELLSEFRRFGWPIKCVEPSQLHVTLKFLGDTDAALVPKILSRMQDVARQHAPFTWRLVGLGAFPDISRPSVAWIGLSDAQPSIRLAESIETALEPLGFPRERRPFTAHLTIARIKAKPPPEFLELLRKRAHTEYGFDSVQEMHFMESVLGKKGSEYRVLGTAQLSSSGQ